MSKGDGTFEAPIEYSLPSERIDVLLAAAGLNRDGATDLIAVTSVGCDPTNNRISILSGRADGTFLLQPAGWVDDASNGGPAGAMAVADLNSDSIPDVVFGNGFSYAAYRCSVTLTIGNGDGTFQPPAHSLCGQTTQLSAGGTPVGLVVSDFVVRST